MEEATKKPLPKIRRMRARVVPELVRAEKALEVTDRKPTKEAPEDPWSMLTQDGLIVEPPFNMLALAMMHENNSELGQCYSSMETNIEAFGHRFVSRVKLDLLQDNDKLRDEIEKERIALQNLFAYACLDCSFVEFRRKQRVDLEATGNAWFEVIRSEADNSIQGFNHLPAYQTRLGVLDKDLTRIDMPILRLKGDGSVEIDKIKVWKRFRRHVQSRLVHVGGRTISDGFSVSWFKDFGDPRTFDRKNGNKVKEEDLKDFRECDKANEVIHRRIYSPRTPYGLPRYIGNLLSIYGDRASEETNYLTLRSNNIPSMVVTVSGGELTEGTIKRIEEFVESQIQSSQNFSKFLIIEGEPMGGDEEGEDQGVVKIDIKPLVGVQHKDALFQEYSKNNQDKIRRCFRLPPLLVGRCHSEDTEYLTEHGWQLYHEVDDSTKVGTINPGTGALEFELPTERHSYHVEGGLVRFKNRGIDALVTPRHKMWCRPTVAKSREEKPWAKTEAHEICTIRNGNGHKVEFQVSAMEWNGQEVEFFNLPFVPNLPPMQNTSAPHWPIPMDLWLEFVGYFVSEGSTTVARGAVTLSQNSGPLADRMIGLISEMRFDPKVCEPRPGQLKIDISSVSLWSWLRENCGHGCTEKRLPRWMLSLSRRQLGILWDAMVKGDGHRPVRGSDCSAEYTTTSPILIDQAQEICFRSGFASTVWEHQGLPENWSRKWSLYAHADTRHLLDVDDQISMEDYEGVVTCFTVPNGLMVTRRGWRILVSGNTDEYTRATVEASRRMADEQIFAPERDQFDDMITRVLFPHMGIRYHKFKSNSPNTTDNQELVKILAGAEKTGGMTPRIARMLLEDILGIELPELPKGFPSDVPFSLLMAEAVKNKADPTEPGQQTTALKLIDTLTGPDGEYLRMTKEEFADNMVEVRKQIEKNWRETVESYSADVEHGHEEELDEL